MVMVGRLQGHFMLPVNKKHKRSTNLNLTERKLLGITESAVLIVWASSLVIGVVVIAVVAFLLTMIRKTADQILDGVSAIWTQGKLVANNTIQIPLFLGTTNRVVSQIKSEAVAILGATKAIEEHAKSCPGCPECVLSQI